MDYPNQKYVLHPAGSERKDRQIAINKMVCEIRSILQDNEPSIYLYGSSVLNDFRLGWSDIDILVLTDSQMSEVYDKRCLRKNPAIHITVPLKAECSHWMLSLPKRLTA